MSPWQRIALDDPLDPGASTPEIIHVTGSAYERGLIHGQQASAKITENLRILDNVIAQHPEVPREQFDQLVETNRDFASTADPELTSAVRGLAKGSGLPESALWGLNLPAHFLLGRLALDCSQLLLTDERSETPLLAKTRDFHRSGAFKQSVLFSQFEDGTRSIACHTSGSLTWPGSGLTSAGVAYSTSGVWSERVTADPVLARSRWLLFNGEIVARQATTAHQFAQLSAAQPRAVGINLVTADATEGYAVELTSEEHSISRAEDGRLIRTNHYTTQSGEFGRLRATAEEYENTYRRERHLLRTTEESPVPWDLASVERLLDSAPICREAEPGSDNITEAASVADIGAGVLSVKVSR